MITTISKKYDENNIGSLILKLNYVFKLKDKLINNNEFIVTIHQKDFTAITSLVLYKLITYSTDFKCLMNPRVNTLELTDLFSKFQLHKLLAAYLKKDDVNKLYHKNITPVVKEGFFIAPHAINRGVFKDKQDIESNYYQTIARYYEDHHFNVVDCIKTCIVEISSNFLYHATDDKSILMSEGTKTKIEIVSVDTSDGIINTMRKRYGELDDTTLLKNAFKRRISSKIDKGHCGTGLWLVNEIVTRLKGKLILCTSNYIYRNIAGRISVSKSSYWQGTILYVKLPINTSMNDVLQDLLISDNDYIKYK